MHSDEALRNLPGEGPGPETFRPLPNQTHDLDLLVFRLKGGQCYCDHLMQLNEEEIEVHVGQGRGQGFLLACIQLPLKLLGYQAEGILQGPPASATGRPQHTPPRCTRR